MRYRPYIDGLRGIAVLAIVLFHFGWPALSGGFLGVDVFFVISGFLITQLLSESSQLSWRTQLGNFYVRRARRILPALLGTSLLVAVAALVIYLPDGLISVGRYLVLTPLMLSNVASWLDGGYFATGGGFWPLKHYWSLAVEEQFYLAYPLLLLWLFVKPIPKQRIGALAIIAVVSIAFCIWGEHRHPSITYFLMPARAWELMFGALAAACPLVSFNSRVATECAAYACLAIVLSAFFLFAEATAFPNPYVMIPCAATALLLFIGRDRTTTAFQLLEMRPLVFTGAISYSLYLWHAPILALTKYYAIRRLSVAELIPVGVVLYVAAVLSWLLLENPIRHKVVLKSDRAFLLASLAGCIAVGVIGACFWWGKGLPWRFGRDIQVLTQPDPLHRDAARCMSLPMERIAAGDLCRYGPDHPGVRKAILWGDSHALVLLPAFELLAKSDDVQISFAGRSSCRPLLGAVTRSVSVAMQEDCAAFNNAMLSAVRRLHPDVTILSAFWDLDSAYAAENSSNTSLTARNPEWNWNRTIMPVRAAGSAVCVVFDVPHVPYGLPYALAMARRRGLDTSFLYVKHSDVVARYADVEQSVRGLEEVGELRIADPKDVLCPGVRCDIEWNGRSLYRDSNHLSRVGALRVMDSLEPCLRQKNPRVQSNSSSSG